MNERKHRLTPYGMKVNQRIMELGKNYNWLIKKLKESNPERYIDSSKLNKILTGRVKSSGIVDSINALLDIDTDEPSGALSTKKEGSVRLAQNPTGEIVVRLMVDGDVVTATVISSQNQITAFDFMTKIREHCMEHKCETCRLWEFCYTLPRDYNPILLENAANLLFAGDKN